jgi:hypothetical protein
MNDTMIEDILFRAPKPSAPANLLRQLQAEIALPSTKPAAEIREWRNPLRRWFPALAFGVLMLSCALMIAVQANWSGDLKRQNDVLRATTAELPQLRERHAALEQTQAERDDLAQLRKDNEELHKLQTEVAQLRRLPGEIQRLQNENRRLSTATTTSANPAVGASFFDEVQKDADRIQCINNLKQIGVAVRVWSGDEDDGKYPTSYLTMSNELSTVKVLICPNDAARQMYRSVSFFGQFQEEMSSYPLLAQPADGQYPECIIAKCPIHHNYLLSDGSVQSINPDKVREVKRDGRWYLEQVTPGATWRDAIVQPIK